MKVSPDMSEKHFSSFVTKANEQNTVSTVTDEEKWNSSDGYPANETLQNTHTHTHTSCLAALRYTRRSTRTANVLMDAYPGSAGGLRLSTSWSCCGAKPPSAKFGYSRRQHQRHRQAEQTRSQRQPPTSRTESTARLWRMVHTHTHTRAGDAA